MVVVKFLQWWVHYCRPRLWTQQILFKCSEHAVKNRAHYRTNEREKIVLCLVLLYYRLYLAKTRLDVSDRMHIHPDCSPVDSLIGRYTLCILNVKSLLNAVGWGNGQIFILKEWCFFVARGVLDKVEALLFPRSGLGSLVLVFEVFGFWCSYVLFRQAGLEDI